ncbi:MAG TPA: NAD+ synthase [Candidatus Omnitrophota bacterium]|nr:NAD+ synthase [Candidatus Omnitrophota bacterium]HPS37279.1 NAD+ synthase [Candidatus Omnitrophota bacterium]
MKIPLKIAMGQLNPTVGDYAGNAAKILAWIDKAEQQEADLLVFPEGALCGYPVWDLANQKAFVDAGLKELKRIALATKGKRVAVVLGFIDRAVSDLKSQISNSYNAAAWLEGGKVRAVYHKQLLPTYDVFLEEIFFQAGSGTVVVPWKGMKVGLTICEDIWDARYDVKPLAELKKKKADLVLNLSASPYYGDVARTREALVKGHVRDYGFSILYVNQVGGQDDLLFDGRSFMTDARGRVSFRAPAFEEGLFFTQIRPCLAEKVRPGLAAGVEEMYRALVMGVRDYFRKNGFKKALVGLSGGIDSALVACIAVDALGPEAVKGVTMPGPYSSEGSWKDSESLAKALEIPFEVRPIREKYQTWLKTSGIAAKERPTVAMENLQARLRGMELMFLSNDEGRLVLTTGNKSELAMGYCTLYGDMAGGLAVIGDVYKTDVYRLAQYRNSIGPVIPEATLTKAPSAELRPGQKDQDSLPPYETLDAILRLYIEKNLSGGAIVRKLANKTSPEIVNDTLRKVDHNEYKRRQTPPILRVTEKAWFGRRMPITNRFQG